MFLKKNTQHKLKQLELIDFSNKFHLENIHLFPIRVKTEFLFSLEKVFSTVEENKAIKTIEKIFTILYILFFKSPILKPKNDISTKNNLNSNLENLNFKISLNTYDKQLDFLLHFFFENKQDILQNSTVKISKKLVIKTVDLNFLFHDFLLLLNNMQIDTGLFCFIKAKLWFKTKNKNFTKYLPLF
jgi:hypothetical protein